MKANRWVRNVTLFDGQAGEVHTQNSPVSYAAEQIMDYLSFVFTIAGCDIKRKWRITDTLESHDLKKLIEKDGLPPDVFTNLQGFQTGIVVAEGAGCEPASRCRPMVFKAVAFYPRSCPLPV